MLERGTGLLDHSADALKGVNCSTRSTLLHIAIHNDARNLSRSHLSSSYDSFSSVEPGAPAATMAKKMRGPTFFSYSINLG